MQDLSARYHIISYTIEYDCRMYEHLTKSSIHLQYHLYWESLHCSKAFLSSFLPAKDNIERTIFRTKFIVPFCNHFHWRSNSTPVQSQILTKPNNLNSPKQPQRTITAISNALFPLFASSNLYYCSWKETFLHTKRSGQHFFSQLRVLCRLSLN